MADMITTDSGLQYKVLVEGAGATPGPTDTVSAHYHGTFEDGRVSVSYTHLTLPTNREV